jgi:hypothetical protein
MIAKIIYFETGTKEVRETEGELFFGDALLSDYIGVKRVDGDNASDYLLVPSATIIAIQTYQLDEELYTIDIDSMKRSKAHALKRLHTDMDRDNIPGGAFQ